MGRALRKEMEGGIMAILEIKDMVKAYDGDPIFEGFSPVSYTHLTLPTICSV